MGMITYLGINFPIEDFDFLANREISLSSSLADVHALTLVQNMQMNTRYVYEISMDGELDNLNPQSKIETPVDYEEARASLENLHYILRKNIKADDFAQIYLCWSGDESEERLGEDTLLLTSENPPEVLAEERFLITFVNK